MAFLRALTFEEFEKLMEGFAPFEDSPYVAVAVSGGPDSLALALFAQRWALSRKGQMHALIVDHRLRSESTQEAQKTADLLQRFHIPSTILTWEGSKPATRLQERAREARYALLTEWCRKNSVLHLLLGHHLQDQKETIALRLAHKTNLEGLAGMSAVRDLKDVRLLRPFLPIPKERLVHFLQENQIPWIEDPSNENIAFERVRWRKTLQSVLSSQRPSPYIARTRRAFERWTNQFLSNTSRISPLGYVSLNIEPFLRIPLPFQEMILLRILRTVGASAYAPRREGLRSLCLALREPIFKIRTYHGCVLQKKKTFLYFYGENLKNRPEIVLTSQDRGCRVMWDRRFKIRIPQDLPENLFPLTVKALGIQGFQKIKENILNPVPFPALTYSSPAFWKEDQVLWTPILERNPDNSETKVFQNTLIFSPSYPLTGF